MVLAMMVLVLAEWEDFFSNEPQRKPSFEVGEQLWIMLYRP
jgi:hypothetical protein